LCVGGGKLAEVKPTLQTIVVIKGVSERVVTPDGKTFTLNP
jgi:hypothetical protein